MSAIDDAIKHYCANSYVMPPTKMPIKC